MKARFTRALALSAGIFIAPFALPDALADPRSDGGAEAWPMPTHHFQVHWGRKVLSFQEVTGLDMAAQPTEYRHGDSPTLAVTQMPSLNKVGKLTLKRGIFKANNEFWDWLNQIKMNIAKHEPMTIRLLDQAGAPTTVWTLANAWPTKITGSDLKSEGNEVAVDTIEVAYEDLTIAMP